MNRLRVTTAFVVGALLAAQATAAPPASSPPARAAEVALSGAVARPTPPGAVVAAVYLGTVTARGAQPDRLVRATTPAATGVEMHTMNVDAQGVMRMREVEAIALAPGKPVTMRPGGSLHLMLTGLRAPLKQGDVFPMILHFERAGPIGVTVKVDAGPAGVGAAHKH